MLKLRSDCISTHAGIVLNLRCRASVLLICCTVLRYSLFTLSAAGTGSLQNREQTGNSVPKKQPMSEMSDRFTCSCTAAKANC